MVVAHNLTAQYSKMQLGITTEKKTKTTEKLSSGYRINRAADDAAGLAISEKLRYQIRGLDKGSNNIQDGVSACQIMDGALYEVQDITNRMKELAVQAANDTNTQTDRYAIQQEMNSLLEEIDRTTKDTTFNTKQLLRAIDGVSTTASGSGNNPVDLIFLIDNTGSMGGYITNVRNNLNSLAQGLSGCDVQYGVVEYGEQSENTGNTYPFTTDISEVTDILGNISAGGGGDNPESALEALSEALNYHCREMAEKEFILVTDADFHYSGDGTSASTLSAADIKSRLEASGVNLSVVTTGNYSSLYASSLGATQVLDINSNFQDSLTDIGRGIAERAGVEFHKNPEDLHIQHSSNPDDYSILHTYNVTLGSLNLSGLSVLSGNDANEAIKNIDYATDRISSIRAQIGADQNGLEHSYALNRNTNENTTAAESRIRDTDMAKELVEYSISSILEQAGQSMLAQANHNSQNVLSLLQGD